MKKTSSDTPQVRLEPDNFAKLRSIQDGCAWPVSLSLLVNYAMRNGMGNTLRVFVQPGKKAKDPSRCLPSSCQRIIAEESK